MNTIKKSKLDKLFSPLKIGNREVKNRIVSTAHATGYNHDGILDEKHIRYHERKAAGGAGLIMTFGSASVYKESAASYGSIALWNTENEPHLKELAKRVHAYDALLIAQATHMGRRGSSLSGGKPIDAPSADPEGVHQDTPHVMRTDEIPPIVEAFADCAKRLEQCGWDGIEITSFGGHLIEQFWSPKVNKRTDKYGGDFEGRMQFSIEVVQAVAAAVSDDFIICFRLTGDPNTKELGLEKQDMLRIAKRLDELECIDVFNISGGTGANFKAQAGMVPGDTFERGTFNHLFKMMKDALSVPVIGAGRILDPVQAEKALEADQVDLVAMTRAIIADPDLPKLAEEGNVEKIRPCIGCNEGCLGRVYSGMPLVCTVNPAIADDSLENYGLTNAKRRVVIVGGGPAGMETARVAATRGHEVILLEESDRLGGKVDYAALAKERPHYGLHNEWLKKEIGSLKIELHFHTKGTLETIINLNPDTVVIATGSETIHSSYYSSNNQIVSDLDILKEKVEINSTNKVLVYDREGSFRGGSVSNFIAEKGAQVEIATHQWSVSDKLDPFRKAELYKIYGQKDIKLSPTKELEETNNGQLRLIDTWSAEERVIEKDEIVVLVGYEAGTNDLYESLKLNASELDVYHIGDVIAPRRLHDVIAEGARLGHAL